MLKTTISKIKLVCALTFVPRLLRGDVRYIPGRFEQLSLCVQRRVDKSTSSGQKEEDESERCQRIIDRAFAPNPPYSEFTDMDSKHKESLMSMVTPQIPDTPEKQCEKCQRLINEIFGEENTGDVKTDKVDPVCIPLTELQATTAKESAETLAQKIEKLDETPMVEAAAKLTNEGFNVQPKVLGHRKKRRSHDEIPVLSYSTDKTFHGRRRGSNRKDSSLDELAKRCLNSPTGQIDERLLKEMEKLGVPPPTRKGSRRTAHDAGIVQPEIMRRPRRPVEKTELDFLTMSKAHNYERLNNDLPPPFELIPVKANATNLDSSYDTGPNTLIMERIQPYHLNDLMNDDARFSHEDRPPQQLLGHMTATVMSGESGTMTDKSNEIEHLIVRQKESKPTRLENETAVEPDGHHILEPVEKDRPEEKISLSKLKQLEEQEENPVSREKLASTNLLSELVNPQEISPQSLELIREYKEIEALRNLLQSRNEYLAPERIKRMYPRHEQFEKAEDTTPANATLRSYSQNREMITPHQLFNEISIISRETEIGIQMDDFYNFETTQSNLKVESTESGRIIPNNSATGGIIEHASIVSEGNPPTYEPKILLNEVRDQFNETTDSHCKTSVAEGYDKKHNLFTNEITTKADAECRTGESEWTVFSSGETRPLGLNDNEDPVIIAEMGRLEQIDENKKVDQKLQFAPTKEPVPPQYESQQPMTHVTPETLLNPLLDKGAVAHVAEERINSNMSSANSDMVSVNLPKEDDEKPLPLSEMLRRVRRRNRMEMCKEFEFVMTAPEVDPVLGKCGEKKPPCPPPAPTCPPPPKCPPPQPPCPPPKPPCPTPCKPKCPPTCPPAPCEPKPKCPPAKKSPCDKFKKCKCSNLQIQDALTLLLYLGPQFHIPKKSLFPLIACTVNLNPRIPEVPNTVLTERLLRSIHKLRSLVLVASLTEKVDGLESTVAGQDSADYAKTYDPWVPIPSWPIPVKEERKKVVCPKDGCRVIPPKLNAPCRDVNPCINFPKKHFSLIDFFNVTLG